MTPSMEKDTAMRGEARYRPTEMEMGMVPIEITGMEQRAGTGSSWERILHLTVW